MWIYLLGILSNYLIAWGYEEAIGNQHSCEIINEFVNKKDQFQCSLDEYDIFSEALNKAATKRKIGIIGCFGTDHVIPTIDIAKWLVLRGHDVVFYGPLHMQKKIELSGAKFVPYPEQNITFKNNREKEEMEQKIIAYGAIVKVDYFINNNLPWFLESCEKENFDGIIFHHFAIFGFAVAKYLNLPNLCLTCGAVPPEREKIGDDYPKNWKKRKIDFSAEVQKQVPYIGEISKKVHSCSNVGKVLMVTPKKFVEAIANRTIKESYRYIHLSSIMSKNSHDYVPELKENSLIYFAFGTIFTRYSQDIYDSVAKFFCGTKYELIMTTGGNEELYQYLLPKYSNCSNISINLYVNQMEVLRRTAIFINHAGFNSVQEAIPLIIPMIVIPQGADQYAIARCIHSLKIGINFRDLKWTITQNLRYALNEIEKNFTNYKENIKKVLKTHFDGEKLEDSIIKVENYLFNSTRINKKLMF
ncbi:unnamed protein product [Blepharisma stoltei]|uniref:Glycosyltransferase n=1 Tax=Blepharisma stoltei TaxID=1481888 RepID=A0AAU9K798_9CILI|nr:unnamed protein product [Blepharisma stoltei]